MKKYLFGVFAVILAISFSAFSITKPKAEKNLMNGFWYAYNPSSNQISLLPDGNVSITETRAKQVTGCDVPSTANECSRLYSSQQTGTFPKTAPSSGIVESLFVQP
jgi:hypothetical protein